MTKFFLRHRTVAIIALLAVLYALALAFERFLPLRKQTESAESSRTFRLVDEGDIEPQSIVRPLTSIVVTPPAVKPARTSASAEPAGGASPGPGIAQVAVAAANPQPPIAETAVTGENPVPSSIAEAEATPEAKQATDGESEYLPQQTVSVMPGIPAKEVLSRIEYPPEALRRGIEGVVYLELLIDREGTIRKINVLKDPGHGFADAAVRALAGMRCTPAVTNGKPVAVRFRYPVRFSLN